MEDGCVYNIDRVRQNKCAVLMGKLIRIEMLGAAVSLNLRRNYKYDRLFVIRLCKESFWPHLERKLGVACIKFSLYLSRSLVLALRFI